jgi:hypothetical protein
MHKPTASPKDAKRIAHGVEGLTLCSVRSALCTFFCGDFLEQLQGFFGRFLVDFLDSEAGMETSSGRRRRLTSRRTPATSIVAV